MNKSNEVIHGETLDSERALYGINGASIINCLFDGPNDGESALKETSNLTIDNCYFNLRYPLWHTKGTSVSNSTMTDKCRAALWYDKNITLENCHINGIKALRECKNVTLDFCHINSPEFLWKCNGLNLTNCKVESEYPFFESENLEIDTLDMTGKYSFQYVSNAVVKNSCLNTKDAFWHSKNVTVVDSVVSGEYLGWYSENLKFIHCRIVGTQPLCYCKNLVMEHCIMEDCDLAFEYSTVNVNVHSKIDSIKNPKSGKIIADSIGDLIIEEERINHLETEIICKNIMTNNKAEVIYQQA